MDSKTTLIASHPHQIAFRVRRRRSPQRACVQERAPSSTAHSKRLSTSEPDLSIWYDDNDDEDSHHEHSCHGKYNNNTTPEGTQRQQHGPSAQQKGTDHESEGFEVEHLSCSSGGTTPRNSLEEPRAQPRHRWIEVGTGRKYKRLTSEDSSSLPTNTWTSNGIIRVPPSTRNVAIQTVCSESRVWNKQEVVESGHHSNFTSESKKNTSMDVLLSMSTSHGIKTDDITMQDASGYELSDSGEQADATDTKNEGYVLSITEMSGEEDQNQGSSKKPENHDTICVLSSENQAHQSICSVPNIHLQLLSGYLSYRGPLGVDGPLECGQSRDSQAIDNPNALIQLDGCDRFWKAPGYLRIYCQNEVFLVHRWVLSHHSRTFHTLLQQNTDTPVHQVVLRGVSPNTLKNLINWMYTGHIQSMMMDIIDILLVSEGLDIPDLTYKCRDYLLHMIQSPGHGISIFQLAFRHGLPELAASVLDRIIHNFSNVADTNEFLSLKAPEACSILSCDQLHATSELDVYKAAIRWLMADWNNRRDKVERIMRCIRFAHMDTDDIEAVLSPSVDSPVQQEILSNHHVQGDLCNALLYKLYQAENRQTSFTKYVPPSRSFVSTDIHKDLRVVSNESHHGRDPQRVFAEIQNRVTVELGLLSPDQQFTDCRPTVWMIKPPSAEVVESNQRQSSQHDANPAAREVHQKCRIVEAKWSTDAHPGSQIAFSGMSLGIQWSHFKSYGEGSQFDSDGQQSVQQVLPLWPADGTARGPSNGTESLQELDSGTSATKTLMFPEDTLSKPAGVHLQEHHSKRPPMSKNAKRDQWKGVLSSNDGHDLRIHQRCTETSANNGNIADDETSAYVDHDFNEESETLIREWIKPSLNSTETSSNPTDELNKAMEAMAINPDETRQKNCRNVESSTDDDDDDDDAKEEEWETEEENDDDWELISALSGTSCTTSCNENWRKNFQSQKKPKGLKVYEKESYWKIGSSEEGMCLDEDSSKTELGPNTETGKWYYTTNNSWQNVCRVSRQLNRRTTLDIKQVDKKAGGTREHSIEQREVHEIRRAREEHRIIKQPEDEHQDTIYHRKHSQWTMKSSENDTSRTDPESWPPPAPINHGPCGVPITSCSDTHLLTSWTPIWPLGTLSPNVAIRELISPETTLCLSKNVGTQTSQCLLKNYWEHSSTTSVNSEASMERKQGEDQVTGIEDRWSEMPSEEHDDSDTDMKYCSSSSSSTSTDNSNVKALHKYHGPHTKANTSSSDKLKHATDDNFKILGGPIPIARKKRAATKEKSTDSSPSTTTHIPKVQLAKEGHHNNSKGHTDTVYNCMFPQKSCSTSSWWSNTNCSTESIGTVKCSRCYNLFPRKRKSNRKCNCGDDEQRQASSDSAGRDDAKPVLRDPGAAPATSGRKAFGNGEIHKMDVQSIPTKPKKIPPQNFRWAPLSDYQQKRTKDTQWNLADNFKMTTTTVPSMEFVIKRSSVEKELCPPHKPKGHRNTYESTTKTYYRVSRQNMGNGT